LGCTGGVARRIELAESIADFERGATNPRRQTLAQLIASLDAAGVEFLNSRRPGVRFRARLSD